MTTFSFQSKNIAIFGDCSAEDFSSYDSHTFIEPKQLSDKHYESRFKNYPVDGAIYAFRDRVNTACQQDIEFFYRNGIPLCVWNKSGRTTDSWLRFHARAVFTRKERVVEVLLALLGLFET